MGQTGECRPCLCWKPKEMCWDCSNCQLCELNESSTLWIGGLFAHTKAGALSKDNVTSWGLGDVYSQMQLLCRTHGMNQNWSSKSQGFSEQSLLDIEYKSPLWLFKPSQVELLTSVSALTWVSDTKKTHKVPHAGWCRLLTRSFFRDPPATIRSLGQEIVSLSVHQDWKTKTLLDCRSRIIREISSGCDRVSSWF